MNVRSKSSGFALAASLFCCSAPNVSAQQNANGMSVYKQLDGYDAVAAVTDDFIIPSARFFKAFAESARESPALIGM